MCTGGNSTTNDVHTHRQKSPVSQVYHRPTTNGSSRKSTKKCAVCNKMIDEEDYVDHVDQCGARSSPKLRNNRNTKECVVCYEAIPEADYVDHIDTYHRQPSAKQKKTKECAVCHKVIPEADYVEHLETCLNQSAAKPKRTKECVICYKIVPEDDYVDHLETCASQSAAKQMKSKQCTVCSKAIPRADYVDHVDQCVPRSSPKLRYNRNTKECVVCYKAIPEADYPNHLETCLNQSVAKQKKTKECTVCSKNILRADYADHVDICHNQSSAKPNNTKECIMCFKDIANADYIEHVNACVSGSTSSKNAKPVTKQSQPSCFSCSSPVNSSKGSSHVIPCRSHHIYCVKCLRRSMDEYIQSNTVPICHPAFCDYQFSRHDVTCLPLEPDTITRLLTLVKTTQRPQCPLCLFYVNFEAKGDLEKHAASCNAENLIPCEYCHCLYNMHRLDDHTRQCRTAPSSQQRKALIDFILPRTKYPLTAQQLPVFIEHRKKNRLPLDPHSIVDALAELEGAFPFEVRTRDCDVCMEACVYDDIFVFGCDESHKLCYECFERSCTTKMTSNEVLTCAVCAYQLQDGELKQLRVPADRKRQFLEYQMQKTFNAYSANKQGMIKCPKQGCKWIAEAQNPNDRFQVTCPICHHQFCSLCNQQYHFRTTCQQLPEITQRWFFWCNTERGNYWQARAQQDAAFNAQLQDFERQRAANDQRNAELQQRYNELLADENYKAQNCRLCPHCRRVVQHLGGCDAMVCGRNYHGGDDQSGCGKGFNFSQALPYTPIGNTGPQQVRMNLPTPEQQKAIVHEGIQCDACHNVVQGIRFDCIHCASLIFCEKCEQRSTLEHSNQIRNEQKQQHVFQLIVRS